MVKEGKADATTLRRIDRSNKINTIKAALDVSLSKGYSINKENLISRYCFKWAISRRTILEYLQVLAPICKFVITKDKIEPLK